ncbi:cytosolic sulfotransferase 5-like [Chenopodium quinoa]|uniref:cytosolic sulfotransferase 5-like n=1 Tax=Chenopodium quinoa TaxID=63459 RepID=UPI000B773888|nr:cytosolic sulfotransferase 5-like [Chenopodium quinoa]
MEPEKPQKTLIMEELEDHLHQLETSLPKELWMGAFPIFLYQNYWCPFRRLKPSILFQTQFEAFDTDIILASLPKTGTTWLKSLLYTIVNRNIYSDFNKHPLHSENAHKFVPHFEYTVYVNTSDETLPNLAKLSPPRLFATHITYFSLPKSIKSSKSRIIYVCRNPLDTFISSWHFYPQVDLHNNNEQDHNMIEEHFGMFCEGKFPFGPYDDHVLGYWKESVQNPNKLLFMEYEGLKEDPKAHVKKLAEFVGYPFSEQEENKGIIDDIIKLCSLESLKEMDVNKNGSYYGFFENKALFRKGEVGDWTNYLSPTIVKNFDQNILEKFKASGFSSKYYKPFNSYEAPR